MRSSSWGAFGESQWRISIFLNDHSNQIVFPESWESFLHKHFFVSSINFYNNLCFEFQKYRCCVGGGKSEGVEMGGGRED